MIIGKIRFTTILFAFHIVNFKYTITASKGKVIIFCKWWKVIHNLCVTYNIFPCYVSLCGFPWEFDSTHLFTQLPTLPRRRYRVIDDYSRNPIALEHLFFFISLTPKSNQLFWLKYFRLTNHNRLFHSTHLDDFFICLNKRLDQETIQGKTL